ncbi:hypothetical protein IMSAG049_01721 [Clostridiales bacterium]|nr:hypothetical protein IMSAG049_01721 [Clostridiales bacterium]
MVCTSVTTVIVVKTWEADMLPIKNIMIKNCRNKEVDNIEFITQEIKCIYKH